MKAERVLSICRSGSGYQLKSVSPLNFHIQALLNVLRQGRLDDHSTTLPFK